MEAWWEKVLKEAVHLIEDARNWDAFQQTFWLLTCANSIGALVGKEAELQVGIHWTVKIGKLILPQWNVSWGPVAFKKEREEKLTGSDNVWFAATCSQLKFPDKKQSVYDTCVVCIAGTQVFSPEDWFVEDFQVSEMVDVHKWVSQWTLGSIPDPNDYIDKDPVVGADLVAYGTAVGVRNILLEKGSTSGMTTNLLTYLSTLGKEYLVVFTGHSLGGALAPTAARLVKLSMLCGNLQDIRCLPYAGATPGNDVFARNLEVELPSIPSDTDAIYHSWNMNLANKWDVVPHAWKEETLNEIPTLYGPLPTKDKLDELVPLAVQYAVKLSKGSKQKYERFGFNEFDLGQPPAVTDAHDFLRTVVAEHVGKYGKKLNMYPAQLFVHDKLMDTDVGKTNKKGFYDTALNHAVTLSLASLFKKEVHGPSGAGSIKSPHDVLYDL